MEVISSYYRYLGPIFRSGVMAGRRSAWQMRIVNLLNLMNQKCSRNEGGAMIE